MAINVVLFQPEIPPNTGNIARTCAITGSKLHLIKPLGFSIDDKSVKRAGLDYWHLLDLEVHESLGDFLEKYGDKEIFLSTTKAQKYYDEVVFSDECFIVFGRETSGLPAELHERYKENRIKIPMLQNEAARSLNLSNSAAIIIYEALRQLDFPTLK
ncbi:MAG: tRNA (uridine(34)/cytosine(34)/5-carboxymethylaminomethyluridine(34)-2'-O)-methyltransferase TrmL [Clostridia bacterium]|nr:tRNA (uridine(34)/cytosine(34)/5-carboxymethylaminomethyluridine(34)-2'-O)-methyltransferase TrmL [Clostridia bacterium]